MHLSLSGQFVMEVRLTIQCWFPHHDMQRTISTCLKLVLKISKWFQVGGWNFTPMSALIFGFPPLQTFLSRLLSQNFPPSQSTLPNPLYLPQASTPILVRRGKLSCNRHTPFPLTHVRQTHAWTKLFRSQRWWKYGQGVKGDILEY